MIAILPNSSTCEFGDLYDKFFLMKIYCRRLFVSKMCLEKTTWDLHKKEKANFVFGQTTEKLIPTKNVMKWNCRISSSNLVNLQLYFLLERGYFNETLITHD